MLGKHAVKDKAKIKFMQKYYHKGAFYMVSLPRRVLEWCGLVRLFGCFEDMGSTLRDFP